MAKFALGIILSIILLMSGLGYDVNYAEARGPDEPCAYTDKHHWLKISYDSQKGEATCKKVDYWVPEKCGKIAGLYKTDPACQPPEPQEEPKQEPKQEPQKESQQEQIPVPKQQAAPADLAYQQYQSGKSGGMDSGLIMWLLIVGGIVVAVIIIARTLITGEFHLGASQFGDYDDK